MVIGTYISIITLNVSGLNAPTKRHRLTEWIQKQDLYICCLQETHFRPRDTYRLKVRRWKKIFHENGNQKKAGGTSLVAQWLRIRLPMQGTQVRALVWENPTYHRATKPMCHNYWACTLEPVSHNYWACVPQVLKPVHLEPTLRNKRSHCNEKPVHLNENPTPPINKLIN